MNQPIGHITQLRLYPLRPPWSVGPGWAAIGGALAAGGFSLSPETLLKLLLVWLLADPVLGTVWELGIGGNNAAREGNGIWRRLFNPRLPDTAPPPPLLPYTQPNSPGRRLADRLGRRRLWWQEIFWPETGGEFITLIAALGLALLLGLILGRSVLALVLLFAILSWLAGMTQGESAPDPAHQGIAILGRALAEFGIPWLVGAVALGRPTWAVGALGVCYTITYFGLVRHATRAAPDLRLIGASQVTAALLLAGLRHPLAAGATAILLTPQWGLRVWAGQPYASSRYLQGVQPFILSSILVAALAIAS